MPTSEGLKESVEKLCIDCADNDFGWSGTWLLPKRLFKGCNVEGLQAVAKRLQPVSFKDSDVVFRAGEFLSVRRMIERVNVFPCFIFRR